MLFTTRRPALCALATPLLVALSLAAPALAQAAPRTITTFAGDGTVGYSGDNGPATEAELSDPDAVAVDGSGDLLIADSANSVVREVNAATGDITTVAGDGVDGDGVDIGDNGPATDAELSDPTGVAVDAEGDLFIADTVADVVREVHDSNGHITTVAGNGTLGYSGDNGPATEAELSDPDAVAVDSAGDLFIADSANSVVREVSAANGDITTVAGDWTAGYSGDNGPATDAELSDPTGVAVDADGDLFIADEDDNVVREVSAANGDITTVAGDGTAGYSGDNGPATEAELSDPDAVAVDGSGDLLIADSANSVVREVSAANGDIATVAGGGSGASNGPATDAEFANPTGAALNAEGDLFIADSGNNLVHEVTAPPPTVTLSCNPSSWTNATLTCTADADPGAGSGATITRITYSVNGASTPTAVSGLTSDGNGGKIGSFTLDRSELENGENAVSVTATDSDTLTATSARAAVLYDNQAPKVSFKPVSDALSGSVELSGSATLPPVAGITPPYIPPTISSAVIQYSSDGGARWATACRIDDPIDLLVQGCSWDTTAVSDGTYELRETVTDVAGNTGVSAVQMVTVQNDAPSTPTVSTPAPTTSTPAPTTTTPPVSSAPAPSPLSLATKGLVTFKRTGKADTYMLTAGTTFTDGTAIARYTWALGAKTIGRARTLTYKFSRAGTYRVTFTATSADGRTASATLKVNAPRPQARTATIAGFKPGSAALPPGARRLLTKLRAAVKASRTVTITGYGDGAITPRSSRVSARSAALKLATARARAVSDYLFGRRRQPVKLTVRGSDASTRPDGRVTLAYTFTAATTLRQVVRS